MKAKSTPVKVILAIVLILVAMILLCFAYLAFIGFQKEIDECPSKATMSAEGSYQFDAEGNITLELTNGDVLWLLEKQAGGELKELIEKELPVNATITTLTGRMVPDGCLLYVNAKLFGFLPLHLKASVSQTWSDGVLTVTLDEVYLGKLIHVSKEFLASKGIDTKFSTSYRGGEDYTITSMRLEQDRAVIELTSNGMDEILSSLVKEAYQTACMMKVLGADDSDCEEMICLLTDASLHSTPGVETILASVVEDGNLSQLGNELMALCKEENQEKIKEQLSEVMRHFIFGDFRDSETMYATVVKSREERQALYEAALIAARSDYAELNWQLETYGFSRLSDGQKITPSSFDSELFGDDPGAFYLLMTYSSAFAVHSADMPPLHTVSFGSGVRRSSYPKSSADLGMYVMTACGEKAMCYYLHDGTFVISLATQRELNKAQSGHPNFMLEEDIPKPHMRPDSFGATDTVSALSIMIPD